MAYLIFDPDVNVLTLDLHACADYVVSDVLDAKIVECFQQGVSYLEVVYGRGIGSVRNAVMDYLQKPPRDLVIATQGVRLDGEGYIVPVPDAGTGMLLRIRRNPSPQLATLRFAGFVSNPRSQVSGYNAPVKRRLLDSKVSDGFGTFLGVEERGIKEQSPSAPAKTISPTLTFSTKRRNTGLHEFEFNPRERRKLSRCPGIAEVNFLKGTPHSFDIAYCLEEQLILAGWKVDKRVYAGPEPPERDVLIIESGDSSPVAMLETALSGKRIPVCRWRSKDVVGMRIIVSTRSAS